MSKVRHDLGHALERAERAVWEEATRLAHSAGALTTFAAGLRLLPDGEAVAHDLGLPSDVPVEAALRRHGGAPPFAVGMEWLATAPGLRGKLRVIGRKVFPPPAFMRAWKPLARRGPLGLAAAYLWRPFWVAWWAIPAFRAWHRGRREAQRSRRPGPSPP